jgi:hypothetical protein
MTYKFGDFSFIKDKLSRDLIEDMFEMVNSNNKWHLFDIDPPEGKGFWNDPEINKYMCKIGHSGFSYGYTMRQIQLIHKEGWDNYVKYWTKSDN